MKSLQRYSDSVYYILRIIAGLMFACHGLDHVFGAFGHPAKSTFIFVGGWIELITGTLIGFGLLTRPAALLASGTMAVAFFKLHAEVSLIPIVSGSDAAVLNCWIFLFVFFYGPGRWSCDWILATRSRVTHSWMDWSKIWPPHWK
jgi:putative oxidoreductase